MSWFTENSMPPFSYGEWLGDHSNVLWYKWEIGKPEPWDLYEFFNLRRYFAFVEEAGAEIQPRNIVEADDEPLRPYLERYQALNGGRIPDRQTILDCVDYQYINDNYRGPERRNIAHPLVSEPDLESMRVFTAWLSTKDPVEQTYLSGFQPCTWHLIVIGKFGIPVAESLNFGDTNYEATRLVAARPASAQELIVLTDIYSVDYLSDAPLSRGVA